MDLYLVRHAPVNLESTVCYGQLNVQTDSTFDDVCLSLTPLFKKLENSKVYSSPLNRCALMAQYFFDEFSVVNDLMEINFGDWEGIPWDHIPRIEIDKWVDDISDFKPNNGESLREMHQRVVKFVNYVILQNQKSVILFTHAGPIRSILAHYLGIDFRETLKIQIDYSSISKINIQKEIIRVEFINRLSGSINEWV